MKSLSDARVAIVFEWFQSFGGVERVVAGMREVFPDADLFALVHDEKALAGTPLQGAKVRTSFLQRLPRATTAYRNYLPLMPLAVEQLDLRDYDVVLSSSHTVAKGVLTRADQIHVSYTHTPVRYAWDLYLGYLEDAGLAAPKGFKAGLKGALARAVLHYLRVWDVAAANRVDAYVANSSYVAQRIEKLYRREAKVVYPPVDVERFRSDVPREEFFVTVSRLVPYKRVRMMVEAFNRSGDPLVVIGDGPERAELERLAGPNVWLLGYRPEEEVAGYLQRAKAFVFAADEDFGIAPVEAQAAGCPVIAYGRGGALETVVGHPAPDATGVFFDEQTTDALVGAVRRFNADADAFDPEACRVNAERFGPERFRREILDVVEALWGEAQANRGPRAFRGATAPTTSV